MTVKESLGERKQNVKETKKDMWQKNYLKWLSRKSCQIKLDMKRSKQSKK